MEIRKLGVKEATNRAEKIVAVYRDVWLDTYPNDEYSVTREDIEDHFQDLDQIIDDWKTILSDEKRAVWIAEENGVLSGFCIAKQGDAMNEIEYVYVLQTYRGQGVGKRLMEEALAWLGAEKPIELYGASYNKNAISFYERFGFVLSGDNVPPKVLKNGTTMPSMRMVKQVVEEAQD